MAVGLTMVRQEAMPLSVASPQGHSIQSKVFRDPIMGHIARRSTRMHLGLDLPPGLPGAAVEAMVAEPLDRVASPEAVQTEVAPHRS